MSRASILSVIGLCCIAGSMHAQVLPTFGNSRTGGSGMQFLKLAPDARSLALGNSGVATASDLSAVYWNPAGIMDIDTGKFNTLISHSRYAGDVGASYAGAYRRVGKLSALAITLISVQYGEMVETTEFEPKGTGRTFTVSNYAIGLTYARILTQNFSFGLNGKFANEGFAGVNINNVLFDLGLLYKVGVMNTRFGVSFSNFGLNASPNGSITILKFNGNTEQQNFSDVSVPAMFRIGASFDPLVRRDHLITFSGQLSHPTDNNETYALGAEYVYLNCLFLRTGYEFKTDARLTFPGIGAGFKTNLRYLSTKIDYAFQMKDMLGNTNRITLSLTLR